MRIAPGAAWLLLLAAALLSPALAHPAKPITFIVPFAGGQRHRPDRARHRPGRDGTDRPGRRHRE